MKLCSVLGVSLLVAGLLACDTPTNSGATGLTEVADASAQTAGEGSAAAAAPGDQTAEAGNGAQDQGGGAVEPGGGVSTGGATEQPGEGGTGGATEQPGEGGTGGATEQPAEGGHPAVTPDETPSEGTETPVEPTEPETIPLDSENLWNAQAVCPPAEPYGETGEEIIRNLHMKDCATGEKLDLHDLCGAQAYWIYMTAGWCPYCVKLSKSLKDKVTPELVEDGARIIVNVFQDGQGKVATASYCESYATKYGIPRDRIIMAYDPTYSAVSMNKTGGTPYHVLLDRDMRIVIEYSGGESAGTPLVYLQSIIKDQKKQDAKAAASQ